jgi:2-(1,2-epoxy-1,2-dihydrophenyl)acetyl-CoA isomerase
MSYATILLDMRDGIATITLNRPEAYNALDMQLATELHDAVVTCSEDAAVRVVVVTGSGRAFCAGGDVKGFVEQLDTIGKHIKLLMLALHAAVSRLVRMPKPTITAVNGVAAGGGMSLSLAGDLIVATESARFTMAYTQIGASPDDQFQAGVQSLAAQLAHGPTQAYGRAKTLFYNSASATLETQMEHEAQLIAASGQTADFREGVTAFVAKRTPVFQGR